MKKHASDIITQYVPNTYCAYETLDEWIVKICNRLISLETYLNVEYVGQPLHKHVKRSK